MEPKSSSSSSLIIEEKSNEEKSNEEISKSSIKRVLDSTELLDHIFQFLTPCTSLIYLSDCSSSVRTFILRYWYTSKFCITPSLLDFVYSRPSLLFPYFYRSCASAIEFHYDWRHWQQHHILHPPEINELLCMIAAANRTLKEVEIICGPPPSEQSTYNKLGHGHYHHLRTADATPLPPWSFFHMTPSHISLPELKVLKLISHSNSTHHTHAHSHSQHTSSNNFASLLKPLQSWAAAGGGHSSSQHPKNLCSIILGPSEWNFWHEQQQQIRSMSDHLRDDDDDGLIGERTLVIPLHITSIYSDKIVGDWPLTWLDVAELWNLDKIYFNEIVGIETLANLVAAWNFGANKRRKQLIIDIEKITFGSYESTIEYDFSFALRLSRNFNGPRNLVPLLLF